MSSIDAARWLGRLLRGAGIDDLYGEAFGGLGVVEVASSVAAGALADAHGRVHGTRSGVHLGGGRFVLGEMSPDPTTEIRIAAATELADAVHVATTALDADRRASVEIWLDLDPNEPVPGSETSRSMPTAPTPDRWAEPTDELVERVRAATRPMMVVGPGVVAERAVADLHALATAADLGVLNSWGAKGVFDWRSRHHWATVGLQALDLELGGVPDSDLVIACGLDADEIDLTQLDASTTIEIAPAVLGPLAERWRGRPRDVEVPPLRAALAAVTQEGWARSSGPLAPSKVTQDYARCVAGDRFVAADPGQAGYWVARTFATTRLGGAKVPARRRHQGAAVACSVVARRRRPGWPILAVADGPMSDATAAVLAAADDLGVPVALELWDLDGPALDADAHVERLSLMLAADRTTVAQLAVDPTQLEHMVAAAGPVTAWSGLVDGGRP